MAAAIKAPRPPSASVAAATTGKTTSSRCIGYVAMVLLSVQFGLQPILYKEFARQATNRTVLVVGCEAFKLLLALLVLVSSGTIGRVVTTWRLRDSLVISGLPACTYAVQNVLMQVAYQHLPSIVANLMNQTKLLSAALFLYLLMGQRFSMPQCSAMLLLLSAAVLLSLAQDTSNSSSSNKNTTPDVSALSATSLQLGLVSVLLASLLSGLGSTLTQRAMQHHKRDAALVTIELSVYGSLFLVVLPATWSMLVKMPGTDLAAARTTWWTHIDPIFEGCDYYTLIPVVSNALGGLLVGTVTKHLGGVLKSFALIGGIAFTAFVESYAYDAVLPKEVFIAAGLVATSMVIYSRFPYVDKAKKAKLE
ncbi:unnamed protein product [Hyaloperonospora brassicae]|uniref:Sugar phosphate transporter domain-containing protein n=1 Tax=Hyaloperonospora brassicae TaxID=162125 RepID=A0AAV0TEY5_HYABA|nr:unnamed protein product [Hyaloperonospora brassicae]